MSPDNLKQHALHLLRQALDNPAADFRAGQWEAIYNLVVPHNRTLVVQATGWGKSIVYFLSTRLLREQGAGPTVVISPLLALIRNQLLAAERLKLRAESINSDNNDEWPQIETDFLNNRIDVLLISPERLANDHFRENILSPAMASFGLGLLVVDEAHCISDWGHDFRPDYRRIVRLMQALPPNIPALATTATANNRVVEDIRNQLDPNLKVVRGPLARRSLRLQNIGLPTQAERLAWLAHYIPKIPGSGIIYTLTRRDAQRVADWLKLQGIAAEPYYAGIQGEYGRAELEEMLLENRLKALVATTALSMGFDKPDLGFVIHYQRPGSVVHYYQQVGRAGRAIDQAYGILLSGEEDDEIIDYFIVSAFPPEGHTHDILQVLDDADGLSVNALQQQVNLTYGQINKVLKLLTVKTPAPVEKRGSMWYRTAAAYVPDHEKVKNLTRLRRTEQAEMTAYVKSKACLMEFLRRALDDPTPRPCGICAPCRGKPIISEQIDPVDAHNAIEFLKRAHPEITPRKRWPPGDVLSHYGWRGAIPSELQAEPGYALCMWGDPGWGRLVKAGKQRDGKFSQALVKAVVDLLRNHWQPNPTPIWVTAVPSRKNPELVPDFARRLAQALQLPFQPYVQKVRSTKPQKDMQNSFQQARNLDGAFTVALGPHISGAVLLVDDMVDSGWTLTIIAALLRQTGSGPVYPIALANTSRGG